MADSEAPPPNSNQRDLTAGPIASTLLAFALPAILALGISMDEFERRYRDRLPLYR